jgi:hypothetical protein
MPAASRRGTAVAAWLRGRPRLGEWTDRAAGRHAVVRVEWAVAYTGWQYGRPQVITAEYDEGQVEPACQGWRQWQEENLGMLRIPAPDAEIVVREHLITPWAPLEPHRRRRT